MKVRRRYIITFVIIAAVAAGAFTIGMSDSKIDFTSQVKPIFNEKCIACHGGVKKEGGFSVLFREEALDTAESGKMPIVPGSPEKSEMISRINSNDPEYRMPYEHDPLSEEQINILTLWVEQGAKWGEHWAYVPVKPVEVPDPASGFWGFLKPGNDWAKNEIDHFIYRKLEQKDLQPSPLADKQTLLRRASMGITGLPPTEDLANKFLNDNSADAYEKLVDALLASPAYGERWTAVWLDMARYADSRGYEKDNYRSIWRYRDWLIKAFNKDLPYDKFLTTQLAGDLMPNATDEQFIATAFHRNTMGNDEGGSDNEEFRIAAVIDRVNTTWEALMGTTFACVQCHSHTYDPFKHEEYYEFMAFFNNTRDEDAVNEYPVLREYLPQDSIKLNNLKSWLEQHASKKEKQEIVTFLKTGQPAYNSFQCDKLVNSAINLSMWIAYRNNAVSRLADINLDNKTRLMYRYHTDMKDGKWTIYADSVGGKIIASTIIPPSSGWAVGSVDIDSPGGVHDLYFTYSNPHVKKGDDNTLAEIEWFYFTTGFPGKGVEGYDSAHKHYVELLTNSKYTTTPIMMENPPDMFRPTNVFVRGNWMEKGAEVQPDVPEILNAFPKDAPRNRLGLAEWMTSKDNPLTSRTIVNRMWEQLMGQGIAETLADLGSQGILPTHQDLLDWLSYQLMNDYQWSLKKLIKTIVMSATYQQTSITTPETLKKDPYNKYYARGPRVRLSAEQIRDQGLSVAGLLSSKMFGKSVMPYQPDGIWLSPYAGNSWVQSQGEDQYRRAVYTHWKRAAPYPTLFSFDGVTREVCQAMRIRTNTPLQALATLNDEAFMEMARHFAMRMEKEGGAKLSDQLSKGYEIAMYKPISQEKLEVLEKLYYKTKENFEKHKDEAVAIVKDSSVNKNLTEKAALVVVANTMLNLDEFITSN